MAKILALIEIADDDLDQGWQSDLNEFGASCEAALREVIGDDGNAYELEGFAFVPASIVPLLRGERLPEDDDQGFGPGPDWPKP